MQNSKAPSAYKPHLNIQNLTTKQSKTFGLLDDSLLLSSLLQSIEAVLINLQACYLYN